jgi:hypothetical protein
MPKDPVGGKCGISLLKQQVSLRSGHVRGTRVLFASRAMSDRADTLDGRPSYFRELRQKIMS